MSGGTDNDSDNDAQQQQVKVLVEREKRKHFETGDECQVGKKLKEDNDKEKCDKFCGVIGDRVNRDYFLYNLLGGAPVVDGHFESGGGGGGGGGHSERRKHR